MIVLNRAIDVELGVLVRRRASRRVDEIHVADTGFADDVLLMSHSLENSQTLLDRQAVEAARVGLMINVPKTELLPIGRAAMSAPALFVYGRMIKSVP